MWKLKVDADGKPVYANNLPVFIQDDGSEHPYDVEASATAIKTRNAEAKTNRERYEAAEAKLALFGDADPTKIKTMTETFANLDQGKLVDAAKVEAIKNEVKTAMQKQIDDAKAEGQTFKSQLDNHIIGGVFQASEFITKKTILPPDIAQATFGKNFKVVDGKPRAFDNNGAEIYSTARPGELANPEEAMEILVKQYPRRDSIMRSPQKTGTGTQVNGNDTQHQGKPTATRAEFEAMDGKGRSDFISVQKGVVVDG